MPVPELFPFVVGLAGLEPLTLLIRPSNFIFTGLCDCMYDVRTSSCVLRATNLVVGTKKLSPPARLVSEAKVTGGRA